MDGARNLVPIAETSCRYQDDIVKACASCSFQGSRTSPRIMNGMDLSMRSDAGVLRSISCSSRRTMGTTRDNRCWTGSGKDVVVPARASSYRQIWVGEFSWVGFGALLYASRFPGDIDGVVAPYLGSVSLIQEIASAGGVRRWHPPRVSRYEHERSLWPWLRDEVIDSHRPFLYLGYPHRDLCTPPRVGRTRS
jgi:hypothetical protein